MFFQFQYLYKFPEIVLKCGSGWGLGFCLSDQLTGRTGACRPGLVLDNIRGCFNTPVHWAHVTYWIGAQSCKCCCWCHLGFFHGDKDILWEWLRPTKRTVNGMTGWGKQAGEWSVEESAASPPSPGCHSWWMALCRKVGLKCSGDFQLNSACVLCHALR